MTKIARCILCHWVLDEDHFFNVNCAAANAANDQLMAEIAEAQAQPVSAEEAEHMEYLVKQDMKIVGDILALKRFERDCT